MFTYTVNDLTIYVVHDASEAISTQDKTELVRQALPVARLAFHIPDIPETAINHFFIDVSTTIYIKHKNHVIAIAGCETDSVGEHTIIYLKATVVHPEYQSRGLYNLLVALRVIFIAEQQSNTDLLVSTRTQNPRVYEKVSQLGLFPRADEPTPNWLQSVALPYAQLVQQQYSYGSFDSNGGVEIDVEHLVIRRAYRNVNEQSEEETVCIYPELPQARDQRIMQFFADYVDCENGDALLLLGSYDKQACLSMLRQYRGDVSEITRRFES
jgi:hypothetical protein